MCFLVLGLPLISALPPAVATSKAAEVWTKTIDGTLTAIFVTGELARGDEKKFVDAALAIESAVVVLDGPGGNLMAGIEIGKAIRLKGFGSLVLGDQVCASACAIAWLGGRVRMMGATARVGFHAAYTDNFGQHVPTGAGNALVGAYLSQLGLPDPAIVYLTRTSPDDLQWLSPTDAQQFGIDVKVYDSPQTSPASGPDTGSYRPGAPPSPVPPTSTAWSREDDWIQIFSRPTQGEAIEIAMRYRGALANTYVFRHVSGLYVVAIGPYPKGMGRPTRANLLASGAIPADSLVTKGYRLTELAFGSLPSAPPSSPASPPMASAEARAMAFLGDFHRRWSQDNASALSNLDQIYAPSIDYYGVTKSKTAVMEEKRTFAARWPERVYVVRPDTVSASCQGGGCTVSGLIDWRAVGVGRKITSTGTAQYELKLQFDGARTIVVGESGTVLSRVKIRN